MSVCGLRLKAETLHPIGAFKIRGAFNAILSLTDEARAAGVVAHSSGNHAQAVAYAAKVLGVAATVVMPRRRPRRQGRRRQARRRRADHRRRGQRRARR